MSVHSMAVGKWGLVITLRCDAKASHKMKMNNRRATNDSSDPKEETTFHLVNASG